MKPGYQTFDPCWDNPNLTLTLLTSKLLPKGRGMDYFTPLVFGVFGTTLIFGCILQIVGNISWVCHTMNDSLWACMGRNAWTLTILTVWTCFEFVKTEKKRLGRRKPSKNWNQISQVCLQLGLQFRIHSNLMFASSPKSSRCQVILICLGPSLGVGGSSSTQVHVGSRSPELLTQVPWTLSLSWLVFQWIRHEVKWTCRLCDLCDYWAMGHRALTVCPSTNKNPSI